MDFSKLKLPETRTVVRYRCEACGVEEDYVIVEKGKKSESLEQVAREFGMRGEEFDALIAEAKALPWPDGERLLDERTTQALMRRVMN